MTKFKSILYRQRYLDQIININTTPLIDVMLVLIIMLIITIPVQLHQLDLFIGTKKSTAQRLVSENITIKIDSQNKVYVNNEQVNFRRSASSLYSRKADFRRKLESLRDSKAAKVQIDSHDESLYEYTIMVLTELKALGFSSIGFINLKK